MSGLVDSSMMQAADTMQSTVATTMGYVGPAGIGTIGVFVVVVLVLLIGVVGLLLHPIRLVLRRRRRLREEQADTQGEAVSADHS